ncbi:MAG TPA: hypothetical protein VK147_10835 [Candidatus Didemnitutus sp.]|nr:hypothetical protein [Candidatus Didemnitutus sp.]
MRILLLVFLAATTLSVAQRPWVLQSRTNSGPAGKLHIVNNGLVFYDSVALRSFDHGATWEPISTLIGTVCAMSDFTSGIAVAVTYDATTNMARCSFSSSGATWTQFDSLTITQRPIKIASIGETWYLATSGPKIYVFSDKLDSVSLPGNATTIDVVARGTDLIASTSAGIRTSGDGGKTWSSINVDGLGVLHVANGTVYATSVSGVKKIDVEAKRVDDVGSWNIPEAPPLSLDIDSYQGGIYTITKGASYQMYRLDGDTVWTELAYPLPGTKATVTASVMTIDAGFVILSHQLTEGFTDSAGVYSYDLNDFTSVDEDQSTGLSIRVQENAVQFTSEHNGPAQVTFVDVLGRVVHQQLVSDISSANITLPSLPSGFVGVVVRFDNGTAMRRHFLH